MLAIVCPGQGSQTPGFLTPWLERPGVTERLAALGAAAGLDLVAHGTTSDAATITDTAVAQPLIVAAGLIGLDALFPDGLPRDVVIAGHSVGEITATAAAGVLPAETAMAFVAARGRGMADASAVLPTGMSAVLGGDPDDVLAVLTRHGLTPANMNGAGQVVAAGTRGQLDALLADPPAKARVVPLQVAGAFHTTHMEPGQAPLREIAANVDAGDPTVTLLSNRDGDVVSSGREVLDRLVDQVCSPVRWDLCMQRMLDLGVSAIVELPPAGTLVGLAKRAMKGLPSVALKSPDDLDAARELVAAHAG